MEPDGGVFQTDVLQLCPFFEEPQVCNVDFQGAGIEDGVSVLVFHEDILQHHFVEEGEVDPFDADGGVQLMGQAFGDF